LAGSHLTKETEHARPQFEENNRIKTGFVVSRAQRDPSKKLASSEGRGTGDHYSIFLVVTQTFTFKENLSN